MKTKDNVKAVWDLYVDEYKHIRRNLKDWLSIDHPLPYPKLKEIFGDTLDEDIRTEFNEWVRMTNGKLHVIANKRELVFYSNFTHYNLGLQEMTHGVDLDEFIIKMGAWSLSGTLEGCVPNGVSVDEVSVDDIIKAAYGDEKPDYLAVYNAINVSRTRLHHRLKDNELKLAIKECDKLLEDAIGDCAKHMESVYKAKFEEVIHMLQYLEGDARYTEGVHKMYTLLADGQFNRWYYGGIHGHGDSILNIAGYRAILKNPERLD